jgi:hypothetical protein
MLEDLDVNEIRERRESQSGKFAGGFGAASVAIPR